MRRRVKLEGIVNTAAHSLTIAQRSNLLTLTARSYAAWRRLSLSWLSAGPLPPSREAAYFLACCQVAPAQQWLDIGTSAGFYAGVLAGAGAEVTACDLSPAMLREAARRERSPHIQFLLCNAERLPLPAASVDGICIGATLNETACPQRLLTEAARVLRPGGSLWIMALTRSGAPTQSLLARWFGLYFPDLRDIDAMLWPLQRRGTWRRNNVLLGQWVKTGAKPVSAAPQ